MGSCLALRYFLGMTCPISSSVPCWQVGKPASVPGAERLEWPTFMRWCVSLEKFSLCDWFMSTPLNLCDPHQHSFPLNDLPINLKSHFTRSAEITDRKYCKQLHVANYKWQMVGYTHGNWIIIIIFKVAKFCCWIVQMTSDWVSDIRNSVTLLI